MEYIFHIFKFTPWAWLKELLITTQFRIFIQWPAENFKNFRRICDQDLQVLISPSFGHNHNYITQKNQFLEIWHPRSGGGGSCRVFRFWNTWLQIRNVNILIQGVRWVVRNILIVGGTHRVRQKRLYKHWSDFQMRGS